MKTGFLNMIECKDNRRIKENFTNCGGNSGNIVFCNAIKEIFDCDSIFPHELNESEQYDNYITAAFIWIRENEDKSSFKETMKVLKDKPIIPISIGLQADNFDPNFTIHPSTVKIFAEMQEKSVLAVRGNYTAEILNKHGIKNIRIIGCPSMYMELNPYKKISKKPFEQLGSRVSCNYRTLTKDLTKNDFEIMKYLNSYATVFIEQTQNYIPSEIYHYIPNEVIWLITKKLRIFFVFSDWLNLMKSFDFNIGARFHGNVVAVLTGIPALFLTIDSRTEELTDFFKLPTLNINDFDIKRPLQYYYELADYTDFNTAFPDNFNNFLAFVKENNLKLRKEINLN